MKRFRTETKRCKGCDYSFPGKYFITICTKNRNPYFGQIINGKMVLSDMGIYLKNELLKTPEIRSDMNLTIDDYVIMPNHFHVIIIIGLNRFNDCRIAMHGDPTIIQKTRFHNEFVPQSKNLSSVIRGIKSVVTTYARKTQTEFNWQPLFYDHIIRSDSELDRIRKYILENPKKWNGQD